MNILVLGGTGFLGTKLVEDCLRQNHRVTVFSRGATEDHLSEDVHRITGDRDVGLTELSSCPEKWDVCVDMCGYTPKQVRDGIEHLKDKVDHYIYISAVRSFLPSPEQVITETSPQYDLVDENIQIIDSQTYGASKALCEAILAKGFPEKYTILRPQVIVGAGDKSGRLTYWISRIQNEKVLLPGDGEDFLQLVGVKDVSQFITHVISNRILGDFNLAGPKLTWRTFAELLGIKNGTWIPNSLIQEEKLTFRYLPLYRPRGSGDASYMNISNSKAIVNGFTVRDIKSTLSELVKYHSETDVSSIVPNDILREQLDFSVEASLIEKYLADNQRNEDKRELSS
ncbi:NAD-dependent epimerase/dehydratase family protein [Vibrio nigripulchritudo]|uniref:NAD-dependent epimerase/dehydratase family protein n=1 Tax=Vibrio nigripulchritudo TaxID=28173 RepID=UPI002493BEDF|nr:NAD-dependent epimerase/dehydratase family protein [Vibrio nigripulchritudo]BDU36971.1 hypothetical protein TUMSATVNIG2_14400 [Vibrio nigripulchritudo]BDU42681.1 hypothetical protein TUMSATVNIG3_14790 [Vibrio nigripulchritudo]